jgi:hypothetical protein
MPFWSVKRKLVSAPFEATLKQHIDGDFSLFACGKDAPTPAVLKEDAPRRSFRIRVYPCSSVAKFLWRRLS